MHYLIGDIHNNNRKLHIMPKRRDDHIYILGDLFDREIINDQ